MFHVKQRVIVNTGADDHPAAVEVKWCSHYPKGLRGSTLVRFCRSGKSQWIPNEYIRPDDRPRA